MDSRRGDEARQEPERGDGGRRSYRPAGRDRPGILRPIADRRSRPTRDAVTNFLEERLGYAAANRGRGLGRYLVAGQGRCCSSSDLAAEEQRRIWDRPCGPYVG